MNPLLGWIAPEERTTEQKRDHDEFVARSVAFALARQQLAKGQKIILTDFLKKPEVIEDMGAEFTGFRQLTGSCVGVSTGNVIATLSAVQRMIADSPTKALIPWWPFAYGMSRALSGIRGRGEGSITSRMLRTLMDYGVDDQQYDFDQRDGFAIPLQTELEWSDGNGTAVRSRIEHAKQFPVGSVAVLRTVDEIAANLQNGYPVLNGHRYYPGSTARVVQGIPLGRYDTRGGHATSFLGIQEHESLGTLFLYVNQWPGSTYKTTPDMPRCSIWMPESEVERMMRSNEVGETMGVSNFNYFPAQPKLLDWSRI